MESGYLKFTYDPETGCINVEAFIESQVEEDSPILEIIDELYEYIQSGTADPEKLN